MAFSRDEIEAELRRRNAPIPSAPKAESKPLFEDRPFGYAPEILRGAQNFAGGVMGGAQRLAATLGEAGQAVGELAAPLRKYVPESMKVFPDVNIREEMGLAGPNQVDLNKMISNAPDSFMSGIGKIAPAIAAGGASIPGQAVAQGLWGAVQADPGQENLGGYMPSGRAGAGLTDAGLTAAGGVALKAAPSVVKYAASKIGAGLKFLNPKADAAAFLKRLGTGTREENAQSLAADIQASHDANKAEALAHKEPIYQQEAKTDIYATPQTALPEGNLDKVAYYIAPGEKPTPDQLTSLGKEIANYRKTGDFEDFTSNVSDIFKTEMGQTQIDNLEHALSVPTRSDSEFLNMANKNSHLIEGNTKELFDKFQKKPTLTNADKLQSQLGDDWAYYDNLRKQGKLEPALKPRLQQLTDMRNKLKDEIKAGLVRRNPAYGPELDKFNQKWSTNVAPYGEESFTQNIVGEGRRMREARQLNPDLPFDVTPENAKNYFANPNAAGIKVASDIGEAGRNKILYNLLATDTQPEAKGLAEAILKAKQDQGYGRYITPEMEDLATALLKRTKWRGRAGKLGGIAGTALLGSGIYETGKKLL